MSNVRAHHLPNALRAKPLSETFNARRHFNSRPDPREGRLSALRHARPSLRNFRRHREVDTKRGGGTSGRVLALANLVANLLVH